MFLSCIVHGMNTWSLLHTVLTIALYCGHYALHFFLFYFPESIKCQKNRIQNEKEKLSHELRWAWMESIQKEYD